MQRTRTGKFLFPDFKITSIFGLEKELTEQVAKQGEIEFIAEEPEDMMGKVDAVLFYYKTFLC